MKKKFCAALLGILLLLTLTVTAFAEVSSNSWNVTFTADNKLESNYTLQDISKKVFDMQPGDEVNLTLTLKNDNKDAANWYLTNKVLQSLEESTTAANGGAYEYQLTYNSANTQLDLFDSDAVGGETQGRAVADRVGLKNATEGLEEYVFLETLEPGASATVNLRVALDGETQGNAYQNTLAQLQLNFAVDTDLTRTRIDRVTAPGDASGTGVTAVNTGDATDMLPFIIAAGVSGLLLLILAILGVKERRNSKKSFKAGKALCMLLACLLLAGMLPLGSLRAAAAEARTYTVRLFPGAQGTLDAAQLNNLCTVERKVKADEVTSRMADGCLILEGLHYGDRVTFSPNFVLLSDDKYYVRGVRVSGADNSTFNTNSFTVEEDQDYVVAYGIQSGSVEYTVRYVDEAGNDLAPANTYRGNVGDKPIVAYRYIEGYQPQARNVTKTLTDNASENVLTFTYTPIPENVLTEVTIVTTPGGVTVVTPVTPEIEDIETPEPPLGPGEEEENQPDIPEIEDLDEQKTPLGPGGEAIDGGNGGIGDTITEAINDFATPLGNLPTMAKVGMGVGAVAVIGLVVLMILKKRKNKNAETQK